MLKIPLYTLTLLRDCGLAIVAACATLRLCGALVSERARAGGAGIVCLAMNCTFRRRLWRPKITYKLRKSENPGKGHS